MANRRLIQRINLRLGELNIKQRKASLAASGGLDPGIIQRILSGRVKNPRIDTLSKIAYALDCSVEWLTGKSDILKPPDEPELVQVPGFTDPVAAGWGAWIEGKTTPDYYLSMTSATLNAMVPGAAGKSLMIIPVEGTSMEPTLKDGEHVVISVDEIGGGDGVFVFTDNDGTKVKRLQFMGNKILVKSDNPTYQDYYVDDHESIEIHGKVIRVWSKVI